MIQEIDRKYLQMTIDKAVESVDNGGGPFAAAVVSPVGELVCLMNNTVTKSSDPTAHAEVNAIRYACSRIGSFSLKGYTIYASCEPCPMCLGAIYWAGISRIVYGAGAEDAAEVNFSDKFIYDELALPKNMRSLPIERTMEKEALAPFIRWRNKEDKIEY